MSGFVKIIQQLTKLYTIFDKIINITKEYAWDINLEEGTGLWRHYCWIQDNYSLTLAKFFPLWWLYIPINPVLNHKNSNFVIYDLLFVAQKSCKKGDKLHVAPSKKKSTRFGTDICRHNLDTSINQFHHYLMWWNWIL